ncbi:MAG TPA: CotH kinase family protein [Verrucomicrobiota bacterium]|nr:CotH kinase family protein [Verrucomicrobiota bacterium]
MRSSLVLALILAAAVRADTNSPFAVAPLVAEHSPAQPKSSQPVTVAAQVGGAVVRVTLLVQVVDPGNYLRRSDAAFTNSWREFPMNDDGINGDVSKHDRRFAAIVPAELQQHRRLVRYCVDVVDKNGGVTRYPAATNACPNFAYFVYDGLPAWTGSSRPGRTPPLTFSSEFMETMPALHLIARREDVERSQWSQSADRQRFFGTIISDGRVYDHIQFHNRGKASTYVAGKNKWGFKFNESQRFRDRDLWGRPLNNAVKSLSLNACASPWAPVNRGMAGLDEAVSFRAYQLAGVPAASTHWLQLRVIADSEEASTKSQYSGDLWGLYQAVQEPDGAWLRESGLADGDVYSPETGVKHRAENSPTNDVAFQEFMNGSQFGVNESWWRNNLDLPAYYSFHALNRVLGNVDLRPGANHYLYREPNGRWCVIPWDLDMMFIARTHQPGYVAQAQCLEVRALKLEYRNRAREVLDLFCADPRPNGGQVGQLVDELMSFLAPTNQARSWPELDMCLWNYHPRSHARGEFYRTPYRDHRFGGEWIRTLDTPDFAGFGRYIVDYCTGSRGTDDYAPNDGDQRGYGFGFLTIEARDSRIPERPVIRRADTPGNSSSGPLRWEISPFRRAPTNGAGFAAVQWRVGQISAPGLTGYQAGQPRRYEIEEFWRSEPLATATNGVALPPSLCQPRHTYRVRARYLDTTGRFSHWSEPVQFVAP